MIRRMAMFLLALLPSCAQLAQVGRAPGFTPDAGSNAQYALHSTPMPQVAGPSGPADASSLWEAGSESLLGDRRAARRGDILTVVIRIDDSARFSNSSGRSRTGKQSMGIPQLFGIPQRLDPHLPEGASMAEAVATSSSSTFAGSGDITRSEKLTLRLAATVIDELPNGTLQIEGRQEVRVNQELRELVVTGYVRPADISRQNEVGYDRIAQAQISYGGRGRISEVQQPRYGQQVADALLPF